jgi:FkbM family methyltransferase
MSDYMDVPFEHQDRLLKVLRGYKDGLISILDVGCADGLDTVKYSRLFPEARFICVEPIQYDIMIKNLTNYNILNRCKTYKYALSDTNDESVTFWVSYQAGEPIDGGSSSLFEPFGHTKRWPSIKFREEKIDTKRLDYLLIDRDLDYLHLDVQGAELKVLTGMGHKLRNVYAIWMEVSRQELYKGMPMHDEVFTFMTNAGFQLDKSYMDSCTGNQFYIRKGA